MIVLDGKKLATLMQEKIKNQVVSFQTRHNKHPRLAIIHANNDEASEIYIENKVKTSKKLGISVQVYKLENNNKISIEILNLIDQLNRDRDTHAILLQLPLYKGLRQFEFINKIVSNKDADCFVYENVGKLFIGDYALSPCTPQAIITLLEYYKIPITGKHAVIVGRSNIVGKPMFKLLLDKNATVTVCHSKTENLESYTSKGDIVIVATGRKKFLTNTAFKKSSTVVDVGIHRDKDGLCGDVDVDGLDVHALTPVPGGVGPMTVTMLVQNTLYLASKLEDNV